MSDNKPTSGLRRYAKRKTPGNSGDRSKDTVTVRCAATKLMVETLAGLFNRTDSDVVRMAVSEFYLRTFAEPVSVDALVPPPIGPGKYDEAYEAGEIDHLKSHPELAYSGAEIDRGPITVTDTRDQGERP